MRHGSHVIYPVRDFTTVTVNAHTHQYGFMAKVPVNQSNLDEMCDTSIIMKYKEYAESIQKCTKECKLLLKDM